MSLHIVLKKKKEIMYHYEQCKCFIEYIDPPELTDISANMNDCRYTLPGFLKIL